MDKYDLSLEAPHYKAESAKREMDESCTAIMRAHLYPIRVSGTCTHTLLNNAFGEFIFCFSKRKI
jgi:hypothetical protein